MSSRALRRAAKTALLGTLLLVSSQDHAQSDPPHVIAQLCFPKRAAGIPSWLSVDEVGRGSISAIQTTEAGQTPDEQRVVEMVLSEPGYSRHLILSLESSAATVFIIPGRFAADGWTPWRTADFQSAHPELQFLLLSEQRVPDRLPVPQSAPRIRFQVMTYERYLERLRSHREQGAPRDIPAC